ncbi:hypothetical protein BZA77DRAFT_62976 [Pyronema omphalodes]|nr:hypothetical protein BZA77DRAFT_62976 [Pyronema omphalodes]
MVSTRSARSVEPAALAVPPRTRTARAASEDATRKERPQRAPTTTQQAKLLKKRKKNATPPPPSPKQMLSSVTEEVELPVQQIPVPTTIIAPPEELIETIPELNKISEKILTKLLNEPDINKVLKDLQEPNIQFTRMIKRSRGVLEGYKDAFGADKMEYINVETIKNLLRDNIFDPVMVRSNVATLALLVFTVKEGTDEFADAIKYLDEAYFPAVIGQQTNQDTFSIALRTRYLAFFSSLLLEYNPSEDFDYTPYLNAIFYQGQDGALRPFHPEAEQYEKWQEDTHAQIEEIKSMLSEDTLESVQFSFEWGWSEQRDNIIDYIKRFYQDPEWRKLAIEAVDAVEEGYQLKPQEKPKKLSSYTIESIRESLSARVLPDAEPSEEEEQAEEQVDQEERVGREEREGQEEQEEQAHQVLTAVEPEPEPELEPEPEPEPENSRRNPRKRALPAALSDVEEDQFQPVPEAEMNKRPRLGPEVAQQPTRRPSSRTQQHPDARPDSRTQTRTTGTRPNPRSSHIRPDSQASENRVILHPNARARNSAASSRRDRISQHSEHSALRARTSAASSNMHHDNENDELMRPSDASSAQRYYHEDGDDYRRLSHSSQPPKLRKPVKGRIPWTEDAELRLIRLIGRFGNNWRAIEARGEPLLMGRDNVALKDKARNLKIKYLRNVPPFELPIGFGDVPLDKRIREQLEQSGVDVTEMENRCRDRGMLEDGEENEPQYDEEEERYFDDGRPSL